MCSETEYVNFGVAFAKYNFVDSKHKVNKYCFECVKNGTFF